MIDHGSFKYEQHKSPNHLMTNDEATTLVICVFIIFYCLVIWDMFRGMWQWAFFGTTPADHMETGNMEFGTPKEDLKTEISSWRRGRWSWLNVSWCNHWAMKIGTDGGSDVQIKPEMLGPF